MVTKTVSLELIEQNFEDLVVIIKGLYPQKMVVLLHVYGKASIAAPV